MKRLVYSFIILTTVVCTACSDENIEVKEDYGNEPVVIQKIQEENEPEQEEEPWNEPLSVPGDFLFEFDTLQELSLMDLAVMRNEIYARAGYDFSTKAYKEYYSKFGWYDPQGKSVEDNFTKNSRENIERIRWIERKMLTGIRCFEEGGEKAKYADEFYGIIGGDLIRVISEEDEIGRFTNDNVKLQVNTGYEKIEYNSGWNDGVFLNFINMTDEIERGQLLITGCNTDISANTIIYDYDAKSNTMREYDNFTHFYRRMLYGENGIIYFKSYNSDGDERNIDSVYDFKTKKIQKIFDPLLRKQLAYINFKDYEEHMYKKENQYSFDIDYDNVEEQINIKYVEDYGKTGFILNIKDGDKSTSFTVDDMDSPGKNIRFIAMKERMYMSILDMGPSFDPVERIYEYTDGEIKEVARMEGWLKDYDMDGKLRSDNDYVHGIPLGYFDLYKKEKVIDGEGCLHKKVIVPHEVILFKEKFYTPDVHSNSPESMENYENVAMVTMPFQELEIIEVEEGRNPEIRRKTGQFGTKNAPVKVRTEDGKEGWILWKDGGD